MTKEQWLAIKNNDSSYDGKFYYALKTTGIVCRPSCTARKCDPKNVIIFQTIDEALDSGFRPCKKCCPENESWKGVKNELAEKAKKLIETEYYESFSLDNIAARLYINKYYLTRTFKEMTGMTLLEYCNYVRCEKAKDLLERMEFSISFISSSVGYASASHFTRIFKNIYGYTPREYRKKYIDELEN